LLIVAVLEKEQLGELLSLSRKLGMDCLVEVHNEKEVAGALDAGAEIIGINNRDLKTFKVDIKTTRRLRPLIPSGYTVVSESGIRSGEDVAELKQWGINAILVGETLVTADDIPSRMRDLAA
jgi:indole-3-glycerol phosphate synthase